MNDELKDVISKAEAFVNDTVDAVKDTAADITEAAKEIIPDDLSEKAANAADAVRDAVNDAADSVKESAGDAADALKETADGAEDALRDVASDAADALNNAAADPQETEADVTAEVEEETIGNIKISVDVVSTIAGIAASGIDGVSCMYTSFADGVAKRFGAKKTNSGVKVAMTNDSASIDLYIVVEYGVKIPELAWSIQESVKSNVESMTGLSVSKVNIHIEGISFNGDKDNTAQSE